jgi:hypothetical protein
VFFENELDLFLQPCTDSGLSDFVYSRCSKGHIWHYVACIRSITVVDGLCVTLICICVENFIPGMTISNSS